MELPFTDRLMKVVETTDGTVGPPLNGNTPPPFLLQRAKELGVAPERVLWSKLSLDERRSLLTVTAEQQYHERDHNDDWVRRIPGLKMPDELLKEWQANGLGRGPLSEAEWGVVEYSSPKKMRDVSGAELHLLAKKPAGQIVKRVWQFLEEKSLAPSRPAFHEHILRGLDELLPMGASELRIAQLADFKRRAEMTAQMFAVLEMRALTTKASADAFYFGPMPSEQLEGIVDWLRGLAKREEWALAYSDEFKPGFVSLRGPRTYHDAEALLGLEYRAILRPNSAKVNRGRSANYEENMVQILDGLQSTLHHEHFGLSFSQIERWRGHRLGKGDLGKRLRENYALKSLTELSSQVHPELWHLMAADEQNWIYFGRLLDRDPAFSMLLHDWSRDPLFFDKPALQERILKAQLRALRKVLKAQDNELGTEPVREFLMESDVFKHFLVSVGTYIDPR